MYFQPTTNSYYQHPYFFRVDNYRQVFSPEQLVPFVGSNVILITRDGREHTGHVDEVFQYYGRFYLNLRRDYVITTIEINEIDWIVRN